MLEETAPPGLGSCAFYRAAQTAKRLGLAEITLLAGGGTGAKLAPGEGWNLQMIGYNVWPKLGFNAPIDAALAPLIAQTPALAQCTDVLEIIAIDPTWWKDHGDGCEMIFDLGLR
jgi:hypothetical protein